MRVLNVLRDKGLVVELVRPVGMEPCGVQPLEERVLSGRGLGPVVEAVDDVRHVHQRVVKGVRLAPGGKVEGARNPLDEDKPGHVAPPSPWGCLQVNMLTVRLQGNDMILIKEQKEKSE